MQNVVISAAAALHPCCTRSRGVKFWPLMLLKIEFLITKMLALRAAAALYNNVKSITCLRKVSAAPVGQIVFHITPRFFPGLFRSVCLFYYFCLRSN